MRPQTRLTVALTCCIPALSFAQRPETSVLIIRTRSDTVVVDSFHRAANALKGRVRVKGQPRIDYLAMLGAGETVRSLSLAVYTSEAPNAEPLQRLRIQMRGDTAVVELPSGTQRIPTRVDAIPMLNNALGLSELFTRRARMTGGIATIPYFALSGGMTLDVTIRPVGTDSLTLAVAQQVQRLRVDDVGRILGGTISGTALEIVRAEVQRTPDVVLIDSAVAPAPDYSAPPGAPYTAEEVRVQRGGFVLGGTLTKPSGATGRLPAVVTITGSGQQDRDELIPYAGGIRLFRQIADTLSRRGIAVLRLDDRGVGASGGNPMNATSADFADDIRAAVVFLRARPDIDPDRIGLVGHSEGGVIAPMVAATDRRLRAIVLMAAPGEPGIEISMAQNRFVVEHDSTLTPSQRDSILRAARASLDPARQSNAWLKSWLAFDPAPLAREMKSPTLIVQGATDRQVPVDQAEKLAALIRAGGNRDVTVKVIPATNHLFLPDSSGDFRGYNKLKTNQVTGDVLGPITEWLVARLRAGSPAPR